MKTTSAFLRRLSVCAVLLTASTQALAEISLRDPRAVAPIGRIDRDRLPRPDLRCAVDLAAQSIQFQLLSRTARFRGVVKITGTIKNVGRSAFVSGRGQQIVTLWEDRRMVARRDFTNLGVGESVSLSFVRNWDASSPAEGEFPPTYKVVIGYDPDLYIDGNVRNDDCSSSNNQMSRNSAEVNRMF